MKPSRFLSVDPEHSDLKEVHNLLLGGVTPRPIALVSTLSAEGVPNLAPFSFFNAFGANPPHIAFSPAFSGRDGSAKDTLLNLQDVPECVVHAVSHEIVEQMSLASSAFGPEVDEFVKAGFTALPSEKVKPSRVAESPFHMECQVEQIIPLGGTNGSGNLVLCRVVQFHFQEEIRVAGRIEPDLIDLVGRNSGNYYTRASGDAIFELHKPDGVGIGIDQLPEHIRESTILTGNELGKLGALTALPSLESARVFLGEHGSEVHGKEYVEMYKNAQNRVLLDPVAARKMLETAAKQALKENDIEFAINVLISLSEPSA